MPSLKKRIGNNMEQIYAEDQVPTYDSKGNLVKRKWKRTLKKHINWKKIVIPASIFLTIVGVIYLPQYFISSSVKNELLITPDAGAYQAMLSYVKAHNAEDFDNDGLDNYNELRIGSDLFFNDTDRDGIQDGYDSRPMEPDEALYRSILASGESQKTPHECNGVILWPDTKDAWINGAVIEVQNGYQFSGYSGWAKFPVGTYAYRYVDGKHTILPYREQEDVWYINGDCVVVLVDQEPENTHRISIFGHSFYLRNGLGAFLSWLLPDRGWITAETMWLDDTFVDTSLNTYTSYKKVNTANYTEERYKKYSQNLLDLTMVYRSIDEDQFVMASLMSEEFGECIVEVYGYTAAGDLIFADPQLKNVSDILYIDAKCSRALTRDGRITENAWFEFVGCGFNSYNGDKISFFTLDELPREENADVQ